MNFSSDEIWKFLTDVKDPELPFLDIVGLGIVRKVTVEGPSVHVQITPTYSGCPAMDVIRNDIENTLKRNGIETFTLETILSPAWTTDWLSDEAKEQLLAHGIAPPGPADNSSSLVQLPVSLNCPRCNSSKTECTSQFGATACKSLWVCRECSEPFEHFKAL